MGTTESVKMRKVVRKRCLALSAKARSVENAVTNVNSRLGGIVYRLALRTCPRNILQDTIAVSFTKDAQL